MQQNEATRSNLNPHVPWTIGVLLAVIVVLIVVRWSVYPNFVDRVNFAASLASLILAVLAIVYAFVSNQSMVSGVARLESAARATSENNARLEASLELVRKMSGRIEAVDDKLSKLGSSPPPGAAMASLPTTPTIEPAKLIGAIVGAGSWNGLKLIKACQLANAHNRKFDLRALCSMDGRTTYDYSYGYLVATSAVGVFLQESDPTEGKVIVTKFLEIARIALESEIHVRTAQPGPDTEIRKAEIAAIEKFIEASPSIISAPT